MDSIRRQISLHDFVNVARQVDARPEPLCIVNQDASQPESVRLVTIELQFVCPLSRFVKSRRSQEKPLLNDLQQKKDGRRISVGPLSGSEGTLQHVSTGEEAKKHHRITPHPRRYSW